MQQRSSEAEEDQQRAEQQAMAAVAELRQLQLQQQSVDNRQQANIFTAAPGMCFISCPLHAPALSRHAPLRDDLGFPHAAVSGVLRGCNNVLPTDAGVEHQLEAEKNRNAVLMAALSSAKTERDAALMEAAAARQQQLGLAGERQIVMTESFLRQHAVQMSMQQSCGESKRQTHVNCLHTTRRRAVCQQQCPIAKRGVAKWASICGKVGGVLGGCPRA